MNALDVCKFCTYYKGVKNTGRCYRYPKAIEVVSGHQCGEFVKNEVLSIGTRRNKKAPGSALIDLMLEPTLEKGKK